MTDEQMKGLITELVGIRAEMATKSNLLKLEEGLTEIIVKLARSIHVEISEESTETLYARVEKLEANYYASVKRTDLLTASAEVRTGEIAVLTERINRLIERVDIMSKRERTENLYARVEALETVNASERLDSVMKRLDLLNECERHLSGSFERLDKRVESWMSNDGPVENLAIRVQQLETSVEREAAHCMEHHHRLTALEELEAKRAK